MDYEEFGSAEGGDTIRKTFVVLSILGLLFALAGVAEHRLAAGLPDVSILKTRRPSQTTLIYDRRGDYLAKLYDENRIWVPLQQVAPCMRQAIVAMEDARFYRHHGVDGLGLLRAAWRNTVGGRTLQGGSTITMQLARRVFLNDQDTISRKLREMMLARRIEHVLDKDHILECYLNEIYFGEGAYGIETAARTFFGRGSRDLSLPQAALLAAMPASPSGLSPWSHAAAATSRRNLVLQRMQSLGWITSLQAQEAQASPLGVVRHVVSDDTKHAYVTSYVLQQLSQSLSPQVLYRGGLRIYTTVDAVLQREAEESVRRGVQQAQRRGYHVQQAALVCIEPGSGAIRAMVGGTGWDRRHQFNRAWQAMRQAGSTFKIFVYAAAFEAGLRPETLVTDAPLTVPVGEGKTYQPHNSDGKYWGTLTLLRAFQQSRDIPAVRVALAVGLPRITELAQRCGIQRSIQPYPSIALGAVEVSPLEMADAVATVAHSGLHTAPTMINRVLDGDGRVLADFSQPQQQVAFSPNTAAALTTMMQSVIGGGTGRQAQIGVPAAGKTGTTDHHRDAWFVGFTSDLATAVWMGNDDNSSTRGAFGGTIAAPLWAHFMRLAVQYQGPGAPLPKQQVAMTDVDLPHTFSAPPTVVDPNMEDQHTFGPDPVVHQRYVVVLPPHTRFRHWTAMRHGRPRHYYRVSQIEARWPRGDGFDF